MIAVTFFGLMGKFVSEPKIPVGELRREIPIDLRLPTRNQSPAWKLLMAASGARSEAKTGRDLLDIGQKAAAHALTKRPSFPTSPADNPRDHLAAWSLPHDLTLSVRTEKLLTRYSSRLQAFHLALAYPDWSPPQVPDSYIPKDDDLPATYFPQLSGFKEMGYVLMLKARLELAKGHVKQAEEAITEANQVSSHLGASSSSLIWYLVLMAYNGIVDANVVRMASDGTLPPSLIQRAIHDIANRPVKEQMAVAVRGELNWCVSSVIAGTPDPKLGVSWTGLTEADAKSVLDGHPRPFDRRATVRLASAVFRARLANLSRPLNEQAPLNAFAKEVSQLPEFLRREDNFGEDDEAPKPLTPEEIETGRAELHKLTNPLGLVMVARLTVPPVEEKQLILRDIAHNYGVALVLASNLHHRRTGNWPASLTDLTAADGIDQPLNDPFSGIAFRYDAKTRVISSVGPPTEGIASKGLSFPLVPPKPKLKM